MQTFILTMAELSQSHTLRSCRENPSSPSAALSLPRPQQQPGGGTGVRCAEGITLGRLDSVLAVQRSFYFF